MARIKPKNTISNRYQAEAAMAMINTIDRQFAEWDMNEAGGVAVVREEFAALRKKGNCAGMEAEKTLLIKELEAWAEADSATWGKKTLETPFGNMGFRISQPAVVLFKKAARSFKAAVELLSASMPQFVRQTPDVDREAILAAERVGELDERLLRGCGLEVKQEEEFWVESAASKDLEEAVRKLRAA